MKKFLATIIVLAALAAAAYRGYTNYVQTPTDEMEQITGDVNTLSGEDANTATELIDATNTQEAVDNATGSAIVNEEFKAKLEAQQNIVLSGDNVTEEDIKLIEDILKQITEGTGTN
jgi:hypothetical protein